MKKWSTYSAIAGMCLLGLCIFSCKPVPKCESPIERIIDLPGFKAISADKNATFHILRGERIEVKAEGCETDLDDLDFKVSDSVLDIRYKQYRGDRKQIKFVIKTPVGADVRFFRETRIHTEPEPVSN